MSVPARIKTWAAGETVSASDLNTEFNIAINALTDGISELTAQSVTAATFTSSGNVSFGDTTTDVATISGDLNANKIKMSGAVVPGWISNLGLTLSSGRLSITDAAGSALSASNYGYVAVPGATAGTLVSLKATAGGVLNDASNAAPDMTNYEWGITAGANWASAMPFFLYAVNRNDTAINGSDGNSCFAIARNPAMSVTPSAANSIGDTDAVPVTDDQLGVILLGSYTQANYVSLPCQLIGAIRMTYATATNDWTISTLGNTDGLGHTQLTKTFGTAWTFPQGQNGASSNTYFMANGGTAPVFTSNLYTYQLNQNGIMLCNINLDGDGGTDGSGAVASYCALPASAQDTAGYYGFKALVKNTTFQTTGLLLINGSSTGPYFSTVMPTLSGASLQNVLQDLQHTHFANGNRTYSTIFNYKAF